MTKEEIVLELTLDALSHFQYNVTEYGGNNLSEHVELASKTAYEIYNKIYNNLEIK